VTDFLCLFRLYFKRNSPQAECWKKLSEMISSGLPRQLSPCSPFSKTSFRQEVPLPKGASFAFMGRFATEFSDP
jgi:hypothetical protein